MLAAIVSLTDPELVIVGGAIGVVVILLLWWLASAVLFQGSQSIPSPIGVFAYFFSGSAWATAS